MRSVLRLNLIRLMNEKAALIITCGMLALAVFGAMFISSRSSFTANIAIFSPSGSSEIANSEHLKVTVLEREPPKSLLILGKYDAFVTARGDSGYHIETIKDERFIHALSGLLDGNTAAVDAADVSRTQRGPGTNILGFMMMFLLIQSVSLMFPYALDREQKNLVRIASTPIYIWKYLTAQCVTNFLLLYIPSLAMIGLMMTLTDYDPGFGLLQYAWLIAPFCLFATSLALLLHSVAESRDAGNMLGSWVNIFTTILAGGFYATMDEAGIIGLVTKAIPQHAFLSYAQAFEATGKCWSNLGQLIYVLLCATLFFAISGVKINREYIAQMRRPA